MWGSRPARAALVLAAGLLAVLVGPGLAQDGPPQASPAPLDASGFEALTEGRIMGHFVYGTRYGAERYLPGRKVIWADAEGCMSGRWEPRGPLICFIYSDGLPDRCWLYTQDAEGMVARFNGDPAEPEVLLRPEPGPLQCPGEAPTA